MVCYLVEGSIKLTSMLIDGCHFMNCSNIVMANTPEEAELKFCKYYEDKIDGDYKYSVDFCMVKQTIV